MEIDPGTDLKRLNDLYKDGKDCLDNIPIGNAISSHLRLYDILRELRDIATTSLKSNHEVHHNASTEMVSKELAAGIQRLNENKEL